MRRPSPRRLAAGLSVALAAFALTACGSDPSSDTSSDAGSHADHQDAATTSPASPSGGSPSSAADAAGTTLTATEADFSITLSSGSLPAGTYTVTVQNDGSATHSLTITGPGGVDQTSDTVQGGRSTTMTVTVQPGEYEVFCPIGDHRAMGMDTTLTVT
ncbi:cupredoxin domain-containing protein [Modestobacter excelsi]|uniref:cupredoxin domain-containing protein n=1 Tax=Modestobacter excelsi TaxID=2213161 RepID=UPI001C20E45B|nr:cupredoxin domain-containing protein [Modestobacter excelsi]